MGAFDQLSMVPNGAITGSISLSDSSNLRNWNHYICKGYMTFVNKLFGLYNSGDISNVNNLKQELCDYLIGLDYAKAEPAIGTNHLPYIMSHEDDMTQYNNEYAEIQVRTLLAFNACYVISSMRALGGADNDLYYDIYNVLDRFINNDLNGQRLTFELYGIIQCALNSEEPYNVIKLAAKDAKAKNTIKSILTGNVPSVDKYKFNAVSSYSLKKDISDYLSNVESLDWGGDSELALNKAFVLFDDCCKHILYTSKYRRLKLGV